MTCHTTTLITLTCLSCACHACLRPALGSGLIVASCEATSILHPSLFHGGTPDRSESGKQRQRASRVSSNTYRHSPVRHHKCSRKTVACACGNFFIHINFFIRINYYAGKKNAEEMQVCLCRCTNRPTPVKKKCTPLRPAPLMRIELIGGRVHLHLIYEDH